MNQLRPGYRPQISRPRTTRFLSGLGDSVVPAGSVDTGGTQVDTGGTQPTGGTANPVMNIVGTMTTILPSAQPTILSTGVAPVGLTPQSPLPVQGASTLVVSDGGFLPPVAPALAPPPPPSKTPLILGGGLILFAIAAYTWYGNKNARG